MDDNDDDLMEMDGPSGFSRFVPMIVVLGVVGGFISLAWYAYHAGIQSMRDEDLLVVEADKTPVKEKPADPGGMQFPNQDKTIFNTFSGSQSPAKVERVLPIPEEPIAKDADSETTTFVNDKLHKSDGGKAEQVIGREEKSAPAPVEAPLTRQVIAAKPVESHDDSVTFVAPESQDEDVKPQENKPVKKPELTIERAPVPKAEISISEAVPSEPVGVKVVDAAVPDAPKQVAHEEKPKAAEKPKVEKKEEKPKASAVSNGPAKIQLGAYRSDAEARDSWGKIKGKFSVLSNREPIIVKADLGDKGIFYRLRVGGFATPAEAKAYCSTLSAKGQACIPVDK